MEGDLEQIQVIIRVRGVEVTRVECRIRVDFLGRQKDTDLTSERHPVADPEFPYPYLNPALLNGTGVLIDTPRGHIS